MLLVHPTYYLTPRYVFVDPIQQQIDQQLRWERTNRQRQILYARRLAAERKRQQALALERQRQMELAFRQHQMEEMLSFASTVLSSFYDPDESVSCCQHCDEDCQAKAEIEPSQVEMDVDESEETQEAEENPAKYSIPIEYDDHSEETLPETAAMEDPRHHEEATTDDNQEEPFVYIEDLEDDLDAHSDSDKLSVDSNSILEPVDQIQMPPPLETEMSMLEKLSK